MQFSCTNYGERKFLNKVMIFLKILKFSAKTIHLKPNSEHVNDNYFNLLQQFRRSQKHNETEIERKCY